MRQLSPHEFDHLIASKPGFDAEGLIVVESEATGEPIGFVHAGFGPAEPLGPSHGLDHSMGTIAMLVVDPRHESPALTAAMLAQAEDYLRQRGAQVIYAGGQAPLNPYYWGVYGGSEFSGILGQHTSFQKAVMAAGYEAVSTSILYETDLTTSTMRDPKGVLMRRQATLEVDEDAALDGWWEASAIGETRPNRFRLVRKTDNEVLAVACTWEMLGFPPSDRSTRIGLISVEVPPAYRRKGYGRHLVSEILRRVRGEWVDLVSVQTAETNIAARGLYESLDFQPVDSAILYRKPGGF